MRHTIPFDTYAYVKQLTAAGVPESQAEVHARALAALVDEELATKRDLEELRIATKHDLDELRIATKRDLDELRIATKRDLDEFRIATQRDLTETELRLKAHGEAELRKQMLWFFSMQTALLAIAVAVIAAIVKLV
jgi:hypothetical protein